MSRRPATCSTRWSDPAGTRRRRGPPLPAAALPLAALALALSLILPACRCTPPEPEAPARTIPWRDTWPVLVLSDPEIDAHLAPLEAFAAVWLTEPGRSTAEPWPDPAKRAPQFTGSTSSSNLGQARAYRMDAAAFEALATVYDEALCRLARSPASFGDAVPVGYRFGALACTRIGDAEGAGLAEDHFETLAAPDDPARTMAWPPEGLEDDPLVPAHTAVHRAHGQEVEYVFLQPGGLARHAAVLRSVSRRSVERCEDHETADVDPFLDGEVDPAGAVCGLTTEAALPLIVGTGDLSLDQACGRATPAPPRLGEDTAAGPGIADLDGLLVQYLDDYVDSVRHEAVAEGLLPAEAMLSVRQMASRALHRRVGLDATRAGDNEAALWALEAAAGAQWSTTPRGANDPEMVCCLALARFRAGRYRPVIEALDAAARLPGWEVSAVVARMVARVEKLPGTDSVGVMR